MEHPSRALDPCSKRASHPFSILLSVFLSDYHVYVCPADYRKRGYAAVCLLYLLTMVVKYIQEYIQHGHARIHSPYNFTPHTPRIPLFPWRRHLLIFSRIRSSATHDSPMPRASFPPEGRLLRLISILETLSFCGPWSRTVDSHFYIFPDLSPFAFSLQSLNLSSACLRITRLISILLSFFTSSESRSAY